MKSPKPNQKQTTQHHHTTKAVMLNWHKNSKNYKVQQQPTPNPTGQNKGRSQIRELKSMSTTPQTRTEPTKMTRLVIGIQPRHHRHTPTNSRHPPRSTQRAGDTHPRNKSTLAHYRVLKQHQHTQHQPTQHEPASKRLKESTSDCFPARHTNRSTFSVSPAGRCRSR